MLIIRGVLPKHHTGKRLLVNISGFFLQRLRVVITYKKLFFFAPQPGRFSQLIPVAHKAFLIDQLRRYVIKARTAVGVFTGTAGLWVAVIFSVYLGPVTAIKRHPQHQLVRRHPGAIWLRTAASADWPVSSSGCE